MARKKISKRREEEVKQEAPKSKLKRPYPNIHKKEDYYVVYVSYKDEEGFGKIMVKKFKAIYAAHKFIMWLFDGADWGWTKPIGSRACIESETGIKVSMYGASDLDTIINYEPTELEEGWSDDLLRRDIYSFKKGTALDTEPERLTHPAADLFAKKAPKIRASKETSSTDRVRTPRSKVDREGKVSANDIASQLGVEGREVRGVLRSLQWTKPEGGWLFDEDQVEEITKAIKKNLKRKKAA
jgi:hypothetical protein